MCSGTTAQSPHCSYKAVANTAIRDITKGCPISSSSTRATARSRMFPKHGASAQHVGKGMGVGVADYDLDGAPDIFVTNDAYYNLFFHNLGNKFEEVALTSGVAFARRRQFCFRHGPGFPRLSTTTDIPTSHSSRSNKQTFPLFQNTGKGEFREVTAASGMRQLSRIHGGFRRRAFTISTTMAGRICSSRAATSRRCRVARHGNRPAQHRLSQSWRSRKMDSADRRSRLATHRPAARHRGCAFGDLDGEGASTW